MPGVTGVHIDRALSNLSLAYKNPGYIADVFSPPIKVQHESDKYFIYGKENFTLPPALRADRTETREIGFSITTDNYSCDEYGFHEKISDRERANADDALRLEFDVAEHITDCMLLDREYRVANNILDSTNTQWGAYSSTHFTNLSARWDNLSTADPRSDIYYQRWLIFRDSRRQPNSITIPTEVSFQLAQMDQIDELRKYTDPGLVTNSGIPSPLWGLKVYEAQSTYDSSYDGDTASFTETWGNNCVIAYINPQSTGLRTLTFSLTFQSQPFQTRRWREEKIKCDVVETTRLDVTKIVAPACGAVMTNVMTAV